MNTSNDVVLRRALRSGVSVAVLAVVVGLAVPALAQDAGGDQAAEVDEVVVTGVRQSLKTSQQIKRDADTVVDSITATDIGAFPDKSVAEALQRVPGVTVNRFSATDDTSHFSAEPSGVIVRGLPQVRNEFNGRDSFSANSSRGLGWGDVTPELMAGVDTYKNQTADMIEGGIAGTVNLRTRVPFDASGRVVGGSLAMNYGDVSEKYTPEAVGIYSDRWSTSIGDVGVMANIAYSNVQNETQGIQYGRMAILQDLYGPGLKYIPSSVGYRDTEYDRTRNGAALAAQWQDPEHKFLLTGQYNRSTYENEWRERGVISYPIDMFALPVDWVYSNVVTPSSGRPQWAPRPPAGSPAFTFDSAGNFMTGVMTQQQTDTGWWGVDESMSSQIALNSLGQPMLHPCYNWQATCADPVRGPDLNAVTRFADTRNMTEDASVNLKWNVSDRLKLNFDLQKIHSEVDSYDIEVGQYSFANLSLDATGERPRVEWLDPTNISLSPGGLSNPNNYRYNHAMDHREDSEGDQLSVRADAQYLFDTTWLDSLKVGVRYANREQTVRYSNFNWANIVNLWNLGSGQYQFFNIDQHTPNGSFGGYPTGLYEVRRFGGGDFFGGSPRDIVFFNMDALAAHGADALSFANLGVGQDQWAPICTRAGEVEGCFRASELNDVEETTKAAYAMLKFGGPDARWGGLGVSGNIGVRYVETNNVSTGSINSPTPYTASDTTCVALPPPSPVPGSLGCYLSADDIAFAAAGGGGATTVDVKHEHWLPSFNLKLDLTDDWVLRFAASRAMARPDIGLLKNYVDVNKSTPPVTDATDPRWIKDSGGNIVGVAPTYTAEAYNPYLAPTTADQFDISLEHYFNDVGSFSIALFYKKFNDYIQYGSYEQEITLNGVTRTVRTRGPMNGDGAEMQGFEVAYQRFFDFLPAPFDGLGVQANYTYVDNQGISNANLKPASGGGSGATPQPGSSGTAIQVDKLEGLSEHAYNLVGMYEKGPWAARLAYNWRSEYLVTGVDCCVYLPIWSEDAGYLDASLRYRVNDNIELNFQGSNLLNTETKLHQQVTDSADGGLLKPNGWFRNDRRVVVGIRFKY
ncbi:TonB-dependent receptor [Caulobacter sp. 17J80-11]|uniref:TonB-dependent receptor n=1 Tax=Caulobacter sp. 17J80-11 TaxID=2763502 RepID=UPI0016538969|nr:TonB-dependent receptor [Caulobacter sp. 17J80-11]MBC6983416.1 TonB-dependent receptor [Caulobacter sp. 17J80-11]